MKSFSLYIFISVCCLLIVACSNKKTQKEQKKEQFENAFNSVEELQEKASEDTAFAKSKEYATQMERACIEMAKKTSDMNTNEKLLLEFEVALKALKQSTDRIKENPQLANDASFMEKTKAKVDKVREYQQNLKKAQLSSVEEKKFYELCHQ
ncbi:hypothetical protein SAMN05444405_105153 [Bacteroides luti]|uniref:Lipoprotein n=1 Tax=Bacteroides luti TaxID=1297750 RepID=A0A1M4Z2T9_9BACE|nr:hypothetical protein [Bacteroides luti]SHF12275.1 hypothetical protein SAMN05444405_105153 [Bacteroides luti]